MSERIMQGPGGPPSASGSDRKEAVKRSIRVKKATLKAILNDPNATDDQKRTAQEALTALATATDLDEIEMEEDFQSWLLGKGRTEDHMRTPWGRTPLTHNEEVLRYCKQFTDKRQAFLDELTKIWLNVEGGDPSLKDLFMYYRFFVRGKLDLESMDDIDYMSFWREITGKTWAQDSQRNPNLQFVDKEVLQIIDKAASTRIGETYRVQGQEGAQLLGGQERGLFRATQIKQTLLVAGEVLRGLTTDVNLVGKAEEAFEKKREEVKRFFDQPTEMIAKFLENIDTSFIENEEIDRILGEYVTRYDKADIVVQKDELARLKNQRSAFQNLDGVAKSLRIATRAVDIRSPLARAAGYKYQIDFFKFKSQLGKVRWADKDQKKEMTDYFQEKLDAVSKDGLDWDLDAMTEFKKEIDEKIRDLDGEIKIQEQQIRMLEADPTNFAEVAFAAQGEEGYQNALELKKTKQLIKNIQREAKAIGTGSERDHISELMSTITIAQGLELKKAGLLDTLDPEYAKTEALLKRARKHFDKLTGTLDDPVWDEAIATHDSTKLHEFAIDKLDDVFREDDDERPNEQLEQIWDHNRQYATSLDIPVENAKSDYHTGMKAKLTTKLRQFTKRVLAMSVSKENSFLGEAGRGQYLKIARDLKSVIENSKSLEDMLLGKTSISSILDGLQEKVEKPLASFSAKQFSDPEFKRQRGSVIELFNGMQQLSDHAHRDFLKRQEKATENSVERLKQLLDAALANYRSDTLMTSVKEAFDYYQGDFQKQIGDAHMRLAPEEE